MTDQTKAAPQYTEETDADRIRRAFPDGVKDRGRGDPAGAAPRGNWSPNETPEELAARLAKIKEFQDAVNSGAAPLPPMPERDILTALRDPCHDGHLNSAAASEIERLRACVEQMRKRVEYLELEWRSALAKTGCQICQLREQE